MALGLLRFFRGSIHSTISLTGLLSYFIANLRHSIAPFLFENLIPQRQQGDLTEARKLRIACLNDDPLPVFSLPDIHGNVGNFHPSGGFEGKGQHLLLFPIGQRFERIVSLLVVTPTEDLLTVDKDAVLAAEGKTCGGRPTVTQLDKLPDNDSSPSSP